MKAPQTLFSVSGRAIILTIVMGCAAAWMTGATMLDHNPQQAFTNPEGVNWITLAPLCLMAFILGTGATLTVYFSFNLLRAIFGNTTDST